MMVRNAADETGLNRNTVTPFYKKAAQQAELNLIEGLCRFFGCQVGALFEVVDSLEGRD